MRITTTSWLIVLTALLLATDVRAQAQAQTPAPDGLRSDWQQVLALKQNTTLRIELQDGSFVKGRMKTITDRQVVVMASRLVIIDRSEIRRITITLGKGGSYVKGGALIGLGLGVVSAALGGQAVQRIVSCTALGTLIGLMAADGHVSKQVIYDVSASVTTDWGVSR